ncbi:MAG: GFA family protein [Ectothiorhodospiraceae bacterium AqS1]|nr:GFA family protein [Ectothiorhodospiraceae bacterium AqS1]
MAIEGGCLCGIVRYAITGPLTSADHCHCSICRRQHGAAFSTYASFESGDFRWLSGEDAIKVHETETGAGWCFCRECGSSLAGTERGRITSITLGTVDGDPNIEPGLHIFVGSKAPWYEIADDLPQFEKRPPAAPEAR